MRVGYTTGVFDMFHIGHLNILKHAKDHCDYLIVGVSTDELVNEYKNKLPVIPFKDRAEIVSSIKYVDQVIAQTDRDKIGQFERLKYDIMFVGDDWKNDPLFHQLDNYLNRHGSKIVYIPYTQEVSSSKFREILLKIQTDTCITK